MVFQTGVCMFDRLIRMDIGRLGMGARVLVSLFFFMQKTAYEMRISDWSSDVCSSDLFSLILYRHAHDVLIGGQQLVPDLQRRFETDRRLLLGKHDGRDVRRFAALVSRRRFG